MPRAKTRVFRIHRRPDGRYEARNEFPADSPLGVDISLPLAVGSAHREAVLTSRNEGCRVVIEVEQTNGKWKRMEVVEPARQAS